MEKNGDWGREVEKFLRSIDLHRFFAGKIIINFHRIPMQITSTQKNNANTLRSSLEIYTEPQRERKKLCAYFMVRCSRDRGVGWLVLLIRADDAQYRTN